MPCELMPLLPGREAPSQLTAPPDYNSWLLTKSRGLHRETGAQHDKWIVITSISSPTDAVKKWAAIPGWRLVVVCHAGTASHRFT